MTDPMILGYAVPRGLDMITEDDAKRLTHVNVAFGVIRDGLLSMEQLPDLKAQTARIRALNPAIRIVLSIGGWTAGGFSTMAMTEAGRRAFADSVGRVLDEEGLDGVDIDWEYPCDGSAGIDHDPSDREHFTQLLQALRDVAGNRIVSIAAGGGAYFIEGTEMEKVQAICDYVQIMTYDLRSGFTKEAGHHTSLYAGKGDDSRRNAHDCVEMFRAAGVPYEKIVIGAAFYSRIWKHVADVHHGLLQPTEGVGEYGPGYGELLKNWIGRNGFEAYWDDEAKAPYLFDGETFVSYDDPRSIACKCAYVREKGLRGIMYWEHACDDTHALLRAMADGVRSENG